MSKMTITPENDETQSEAVARYLNAVVNQAEAVRTFISEWYYERGIDDDFATIMLFELSEYACRRMIEAAHALQIERS